MTAPDGARTGLPGEAPPAGGSAPASAGLVWVALVTVYVVWGSTYLAIRVAAVTLPPFLSAAIRFAAAALVLAVVLAIRNGRRRHARTAPRLGPASRPGGDARPGGDPRRVSGARQIASAALVGLLLLAGGNGMVVLAESPGFGLPSGVTALLVAAVPLLIVVLRAVFADPPTRATIAGVLVGLAGLVVLVLPHGGARAGVPVLPALVVLGAALSWSLGSVLSGRLPMPADPFVASAWEMAAGAAGLAVMGLASGERLALASVSGSSWLALAYLVVAGSLVGFTAYVWLLHHAPISLVATYAYVNPAVAVLLGALLLGEPITGQVILGGVVIVVGVAIVVSTERNGRSAAGRAAGASPSVPRAPSRQRR